MATPVYTPPKIGAIFGRWTVIALAPDTRKADGSLIHWCRVRCSDCGHERTISVYWLRQLNKTNKGGCRHCASRVVCFNRWEARREVVRELRSYIDGNIRVDWSALRT